MIFIFLLDKIICTFTSLKALLMKNYFYLLLLLITLISCNSKPSKESIIKINGYWEIEKVVFPDGNKKEYQVFLVFIQE